MNLRIRKFYHFGRFPYYSIQRFQDGGWLTVLDLIDDDLVLAKKLKKFLLESNYK